MHVYVHAHMYECTRTHTLERTHPCTHARVARMHISTCAYTHARKHTHQIKRRARTGKLTTLVLARSSPLPFFFFFLLFLLLLFLFLFALSGFSSCCHGLHNHTRTAAPPHSQAHEQLPRRHILHPWYRDLRHRTNVCTHASALVRVHTCPLAHE